jgi:hypothetical protein
LEDKVVRGVMGLQSAAEEPQSLPTTLDRTVLLIRSSLLLHLTFSNDTVGEDARS